MVRHRVTTILGKTVKKLAQIRGGGSALPGLFVEKIDKNFVKRVLMTLPRGVVLISGTNGKTTTTKMVVELLEGQGLRVFTNRTGSNFIRGVGAALLGEVTINGTLEADIAVLELDEAHAVHFVKVIQPRYSLLLNVLRDQLDRFGEIDRTADLLHTIGMQTTDEVVINRDDPRLSSSSFIRGLTASVSYYGVASDLQKLFPSDDSMRGTDTSESNVQHQPIPIALLEAVTGQHATITIDGTSHSLELALKGVYNMQNAVGAAALVRVIIGDKLDTPKLLANLSMVKPAFGRGETLEINGAPCELVLVKNPSGFRLSLKSFPAAGYATMIAINDNYADGRDMSWLWDVDFDSLAKTGVEIVSGMRAYDMALRLQYDQINVTHIEPELFKALDHFVSHQTGPKRIYCTYTAMLVLRRALKKYASVETVR